ncbi:transposase (plasmid) [Deinococcus wulumuqiensis]|uniref:Transposase n=1 Tax=Deinococcus wulumuqiensis TaxID=980427 RepID=A0A345IN47_9DEIO|nr:transposase [Deinococcus wulumuqiensis]
MTTKTFLGDVPRLYQNVRPFLSALSWNDVRNADTCAWLVAGCLESRTCSIPAWVSGRISKAQFAQSREIQGRRFLENPKVDPFEIYAPLVFQALRHWGEHRLVLALDTSMLFGKFCLIRFAVTFRGRSLPLHQEVIQHESAQVSTRQLLPMLARVKGILDALGIHDVRLLADRGFCDTELMDWLWACQWHYRIRIKSNLILADLAGQRLCKLDEIRLQPRETRHFHHVAITGQAFGPVHVAVARLTDAQEQWQVVSSEPTSLETFAEYGERFQIEEGFLDDKSGLHGLESSKLRDVTSLNRLVMVLALATLFLITKGVQIVAEGKRRMVDSHWQRGLSYLKIGERAMRWFLSRGLEVFTHLALPGGPDPDTLGKRKKKCPDPITLLEVGWTLVLRPLS